MALLDEDLLTLRQAAKLLPGRGEGGKLTYRSVHRYATAGCDGVRLETVKVGGVLCTSRQAVRRFVERLTAARTDQGMSADSTSRARSGTEAKDAKRIFG